ncbi:MAG: hypothetical protein NT081_04850 [Actinobacteria bacterium]|nr:hypothetical protein [Actinomycetota bacterium]
MRSPPAISRRKALGLGVGVAGALVLAPGRLANATVTGTTDPCLGDAAGFTGYYWRGPSNPYNEVNLGGTVSPGPNLILNPSFEDGAPGTTAPNWIFAPPPPL